MDRCMVLGIARFRNSEIERARAWSEIVREWRYIRGMQRYAYVYSGGFRSRLANKRKQ